MAGERKREREQVESVCWPPSHCEALRKFLTEGMTHRDAAHAINARFGTAYSRSAALGRARRMGLAEIGRSESQPGTMEAQTHRPVMSRSDEAVLLKLLLSRPAFARFGGLQLRCAEVTPRHLELTELEAGDCRYPYGGDEEGEAISFCGHPCRKGSSYCAPHFHLTRNPDVPTAETADVTPPQFGCGMIKL